MANVIYRFEGRDRRGIYTTTDLDWEGEDLQKKLYAAHNPSECGSKHRPNLYDDFEYNQFCNIKNFKFGCPSKKTLKTWFKGFTKDFIANKSIKLVKYKAKKMVRGRTGLQCIFVPVPKSRKELTSL